MKLAPAPDGLKRPHGGGIHFSTDIAPGSFVSEKKILAGSQKRQKADMIVRPSETEQLFCIEAKAVGIRLDATKRLKELNDKFTDWQGTSLSIITVGVIAGFFSEMELIATIKGRGIPLFFEHDLSPLSAFLASGDYHGGSWIHQNLFPDADPDEVRAAIGKIETIPAVSDE